MLALFSTLHQLAAVIWVGGMFFAYVVLRPVLAEREGAERLAIWRGVFGRFFYWAGAAVLLLLGTGYWMLLGPYGGFAGAAPYIHLMHLLGLIMAALFVWLLVGPWAALRAAADREDTAAAARALGRIRHVVLVNLALGLVTVAVAAWGSG